MRHGPSCLPPALPLVWSAQSQASIHPSHFFGSKSETVEIGDSLLTHVKPATLHMLSRCMHDPALITAMVGVMGRSVLPPKRKPINPGTVARATLPDFLRREFGMRESVGKAARSVSPAQAARCPTQAHRISWFSRVRLFACSRNRVNSEEGSSRARY